MMWRVFPVCTVVSALAGVALTAAGPRIRPRDSVSIKVSQERAAPGGLAQVKIRMTDAKPIITGQARLSLVGLASVEGIALVSPDDDAAGVAVVRGTDIVLSVLSPSGTFGLDSDYPLVTVVGRVPTDASIGETFPVVLHPEALHLVNPAGGSYFAEIDQGQLVSWPSLAIHTVVPGSAVLPAGSTVTISGDDFEPATEIRFGETEASIRHQQFISRTQIDVTVDDVTPMHGMKIEARNPDGSRVTHFSYQRASRSGKSTHSVLKDVVPLFRSRTTRSATLHLGGTSAGIAMQNLNAADVTVQLELLTSAGVSLTAKLTVPSNKFVVRELPEIFHVQLGGDAVVRVASPMPVQVLGISLDSSGVATPRLPS